jgi:hypothetical protein
LDRCNMLQWVHQKRSAELSCNMSSVKWKISARIVAKTETYGAENTR